MNPQISCPQASELRELLDGTLADPRKSDVSRHLEACRDCQQRLESLVAGQESWTGAASQLRQEESAPEPALQQVVAELAKPATGTATTDTPPSSDESALDFLDPPREPGHLGRLAKYEILEVIGRGGMGIVLKAFDESLHRVVAVKVMAPQLATSATARQRFVREVQAAAAVRDEHVVAIYAVEEAKNLPFFVMEYVGGQSLQERLDRTGPLEVKEILRIGMQTARGLAAAHAQGLIHRDVKPANILLENGVQRVKITDFGLARAADDASLTQSGVVAGTPQYMAPEQAESRTLDHRADLFSLGSVLYTTCTGRAPFRASTPMAVLKRVCDDTPRPVQEVNPDIPDWLAGIVVRLHAKDPARRFQSAAEVAEVLGQHLARYQQPNAPPPVTPGHPPRRRRRWAVAASVLAIIAIAAFLFGPTLRRYLANEGEIRSLFNDPDALVVLSQEGQQVAQLSLQSPDIALPPGSYEVGVFCKPSQSVLAIQVVSGWLGNKVTKTASGERCTLHLERGESVEISFRLARVERGRNSLEPGEGTPPYTRDDAPPKSNSLRVLKAFGPEDTPISLHNMKPEEGGWRIDGYTLGVTTMNQPAVRTTAIVRLFEVDGPIPDEGELIFRAKMKSTPNTSGTLLVAALYMFYLSENKAVGATGWANYEVRYPLHLLRQRDARGPIPLNLCYTGHGTVWIKDIELLYAPPPPKTPPELRPGEVLVKAFGPGDVPVTRSTIEAPVDLLNETHREREGWWYPRSNLGGPEHVRLYEVRNPDIEGCKLILRAKMKTFQSYAGFFPALACRLKDGSEIQSSSPDPIAKGNTNWTTYEAALEVPRGERPEVIRINLVAAAANERDLTERAGIKDIQLIQIPLPKSSELSVLQPVRLKSFSPDTDTPLDKPDFVEEKAWRFDCAAEKRRGIHLFEFRDGGLPEGGEIIYRAKIKTASNENEKAKFQAALMLGWGPPNGELNPDAKAKVEGEHDWIECEARYPVHGFYYEDPPVVAVNLVLYGAGSVWIKDVELWHVPPEPPLRRPGERLIKRFGPKDKPISTSYNRSYTDGWEYSLGTKDQVLRLFTIRDSEVKGYNKFLFRAKMRTQGHETSANLQLTQLFPDPSIKGQVLRSTKAEGDTRWTDYEVWITLPVGAGPCDLELAIEVKGRTFPSAHTVCIKDVEFLKAPTD